MAKKSATQAKQKSEGQGQVETAFKTPSKIDISRFEGFLMAQYV